VTCTSPQYCVGGTFPEGMWLGAQGGGATSSPTAARRRLSSGGDADGAVYNASVYEPICLVNHMGIQCQTCVPGTVKRGPLQTCQVCDAAATSADQGRAAGILIGFVALVVFLVVTGGLAFRWSVRAQQQETPGSTRSPLTRFAAATDVFTKLRIIVGLMQVIGGMSVTFSLQLPPFFDQVAATFAIIGLDIVKTFDLGCVLPQSSHETSLIVTTLLPVALAVALLAAHLLFERVARATENVELKHELRNITTTVFLAMLFVVYPSTSSTILATFPCTTCVPLRNAISCAKSTDVPLGRHRGEATTTA